jgi:nucleotide-binding universal stress UspA family protein
MLRKILVPTDFSDGAAEALRVAVDLARRLDGEITLLHVYQMPVYPELAVSAEAVRDFLTTVQDALARAKDAVNHMDGPSIGIAQVEGQPAAGIVAFAQEGKFDLVVIGTHGRTGLSRLLIGSVAERVVRTAGCPVLSVRTPPPV